MNIPDKAVEAAARAMYGHEWEHTHQGAIDATRREALKALIAAAPFIAAQALRDAARAVDDRSGGYSPTYAAGMRKAANQNRFSADELDPQ